MRPTDRIDELDDALLKRMVVYADGELGAEETAAFEAFLQRDDMLAAGVESLRQTADLLSEYFTSEDEAGPVPSYLVDLVRETPLVEFSEIDELLDEDRRPEPEIDHINKVPAWQTPFSLITKPIAAGVIVTLVGLVFISYGIVSNNRMAAIEDARLDQVAETQTLASRLELMTSEAEKRTSTLDAAEAEIERLTSQLTEIESARRTAEQQFANAIDENSNLAKTASAKDVEVVRLRLFLKTLAEHSIDQQKNLDEARSLIKGLDGDIRKTRAAMASLAAERAALSTVIETDRRRRASNEQSIADMMTALVKSDVTRGKALAELRLARLKNEKLLVSIAAIRAEAWIGQVARYYSLYSGQSMPRHIVEVPATEIDHIKKWLGEQLDRRLIIPDLSAEGLRFIGARLLEVDGKPTGQLTYVDGDDRLIAFCLFESDAGTEEFVNFRDGDINIVRWRDQDLNYLIVGERPTDTLSVLARFIRDRAPSI